MNLFILQQELHEWRMKNFPHSNSDQQLMGVMEEVGELSHAHLKRIQGIRGTPEEHRLMIQDSVADIIIFLCGYCSYEDIDLEANLEATAQRVMERDWIAFPIDGMSGETEGFAELEEQRSSGGAN